MKKAFYNEVVFESNTIKGHQKIVFDVTNGKIHYSNDKLLGDKVIDIEIARHQKGQFACWLDNMISIDYNGNSDDAHYTCRHRLINVSTVDGMVVSMSLQYADTNDIKNGYDLILYFSTSAKFYALDMFDYEISRNPHIYMDIPDESYELKIVMNKAKFSLK
jgi:hypothetical protein